MRIWSLHPKYLDGKGLVALWRETLLAKHVLEGKTKGYINHPQLNRFKNAEVPVDCVNHYLSHVYEEASLRGYSFNKDKIDWEFNLSTVSVTRGQLKYEMDHLLNKLVNRDTKMYQELVNIKNIEPHPLFCPVGGDVEDWEKLGP